MITIDEAKKYNFLTTKNNSDSRSDHYMQVPTIDILESLHDQDYRITSIQSKDAKRNPEFAKHIVRMRHKDKFMMNNGSETSEIVLLNSHDGTSSFQLSLGIYRMVCANGMIVGDDLLPSVKIRHMDYNHEALKTSVSYIVDNAPKVENLIEDYKVIDMTPEKAGDYADDVFRYVWKEKAEAIGDDLNIRNQASKLLTTRRAEDTGYSVYNVLNRVQENIIRGGLNFGRRGMTKGINSVDRSVKINKFLWDKMSEYHSL